MNEPVTLTLSYDEAFVLCDFFARFEDSEEFSLRHTAEFLAFSTIAAQLQSTVHELFDSNYRELLDTARERLAAGWEGSAPGVKSE